MNKIKIAPSMMCADLIHLQDELDLFAEMKLDYLHIDIMDGHYVPSFTFGHDFCRALSTYSSISLDIHLMIEKIDQYIPTFTFHNSVVCVHPEVSYHPIRTLQLIRTEGARVGIAVDPAMPVESIRYLLPYVDLVCVMTVNPGYAGQELIPQTLEKIAELADLIKYENLDIELEVDGNVSWQNIPKMVKAGANVLVAGTSSLFEQGGSRSDNIKRLQDMLNDLVKEP